MGSILGIAKMPKQSAESVNFTMNISDDVQWTSKQGAYKRFSHYRHSQ